jgi:hypothetical protein
VFARVFENVGDVSVECDATGSSGMLKVQIKLRGDDYTTQRARDRFVEHEESPFEAEVALI